MSMMLGIIDTIQGWIGGILYPLFSIIFVLIDILQELFYGFAGIGELTYDGQTISGSGADFSVDADGGIVYYLLNSDFVKDMFWSMAYLALILIVIFVGIAFFRNIYASKPKNWKDIVGNAIKGICNFIFVPVVLLLGLWVGNILLRAVNDATSQYGNATISRQLFIASAYNANRIRSDGSISSSEIERVKFLCDMYSVSYDANATGYEYWAEKVDEVYALSDGPTIASLQSFDSLGDATGWSIDDWYNLWSINYIALVAGGLFILYVLGSITFGMVKRLINIIVLYIIGPVICSMYPIDDGRAVGEWRKNITTNVLMAYGAVVGMNLTLDILPIVQNIDFNLYTSWGSSVNWITHGIIPVLLTICVLLCAKDFIGLFSTWVGGDNAYTSGAGLMSATKQQYQRGAKKVTGGMKKTVDYSFKVGRLGRSVIGSKDESKQNVHQAKKKEKQAETAFDQAKDKTTAAAKDHGEDSTEYKNAMEEQKLAEKRLVSASQKTAEARGRRNESLKGLAAPIGKGINSAMSYLTGGAVDIGGAWDATVGEYRKGEDVRAKKSEQGRAKYGLKEAIEGFGGEVKRGQITKFGPYLDEHPEALKPVIDKLPDDVKKKAKRNVATKRGFESVEEMDASDEATEAAHKSLGAQKKARKKQNDALEDLQRGPVGTLFEEWRSRGIHSLSDFTEEERTNADVQTLFGTYLEKLGKYEKANAGLESAMDDLGDKIADAVKKGMSQVSLSRDGDTQATFKELQSQFKSLKTETKIDNIEDITKGMEASFDKLKKESNKSMKEQTEELVDALNKNAKLNEGDGGGSAGKK